MKSISAAVCTLLIASIGLAKQEAVVTSAELTSVITKVDAAMCRVLEIKPMPAQPKGADKAASMEEIIDQLSVLVDKTRPTFEMTPIPSPIDSRLQFGHLKPQSQAKLKKLLKEGFAAEVGPLAVKKDGLSPEELGDAIGFVLARIAELSHVPDPEFSPYLQDPLGQPVKPKK